MAFLTEVRSKAIQNDVLLITQFMGENVIVKDGKTGNVLDILYVSTLHQVNYDTRLGKKALKSWFGVRKNIAVNCTGLVTEGLYPEELAILEENSD